MRDATLLFVMADSPWMIDGCLWHLHLDVKAAQGLDLSLEQQSQLQKMLEEFPDVFIERLGLPPKKDIEHSIALQEGTTPISVRPYRYPHYQKNEIERQV